MTPRKWSYRRWRFAWWWWRHWGQKRGLAPPPPATPEFIEYLSSGPKLMAARGQPGRKPDLVADLMKFIRRFVVVSDSQLMAVALWVIHTHCVHEFVEQTPYLSVTSPEPKCGKSRLLEVLELLVARPWMAVVPSEAVVYRNVHLKLPTLLLDEVDTIFNPRTADRYEGLRALINAGHRRGAKVPRCVGTSNQIIEFRVFCPKVLAGIGTLPDTIASRSIPIRLERRRRDEKLERFLRRKAKPTAARLLRRIEQWAEQNAAKLRNVHPEMPDELDDRMQEGCESLAAIADELGHGAQARAALVELLSGERLDDQESLRLQLLRDTRAIFEAEDARRNGTRTPNLSTATLLKRLHEIEEAPWRGYYGRGLEARDVASLLHHYGIESTTVRGREIAKGYKRDALHEAWERYLD